MSVEAITWALNQHIKPSSAKFVLVALSNCADGRDFIAWPSVAYLVEATSQDRKTVQANLALLREQGFIEDTGERRGSTKQVVVYRLKSTENGPVDNSGKDAQKRNSTENGTVPFSDGKRPNIPTKEAQNSPERGPKTDHGTVRNRNRTVKEPSEGGADAPSAPQTPVKTKTSKQSGTVSADQLVAEGVDRQVAEDWLKVRKVKELPLTPTAWEGVKLEAKKAGVSVGEAVRISAENSWAGFKASWHEKMKAEAGGAAGARDDLEFLKSWPGILAKGNALGLKQEPGELAPHFKLRVMKAANLTPEQVARARADFGVNL